MLTKKKKRNIAFVKLINMSLCLLSNLFFIT